MVNKQGLLNIIEGELRYIAEDLDKKLTLIPVWMDKENKQRLAESINVVMEICQDGNGGQFNIIEDELAEIEHALSWEETLNKSMIREIKSKIEKIIYSL